MSFGGGGASLLLLLSNMCFVYIPRNFFGGLFRSPASGHTTARSSTNLYIEKNKIIKIHKIY